MVSCALRYIQTVDDFCVCFCEIYFPVVVSSQVWQNTIRIWLKLFSAEPQEAGASPFVGPAGPSGPMVSFPCFLSPSRALKLSLLGEHKWNLGPEHTDHV